MSDLKSRCMSCMQEIELGRMVCPHCSASVYPIQNPMYLATKSVLANKYLVGKAIDISTDAVTYIGLNLQTDEIVNIREFLPSKIIKRNSSTTKITVNAIHEQNYLQMQQSFIDLWTKIYNIKNVPALPQVKDIFNVNNTSYAVFIASDSINLEQYIEQSESDLTWNQVYNSFSRTIIAAIRALHANSICHARISPETIMVGADGKLRLTSFSIPEVQIKNSSVALVPDNNFSPIEAFDENLSITPSSDIYSTFACMYYLFTKTKPRPSFEYAIGEPFVLDENFASSLDTKHSALITAALTIDPNSRLKTTSEIVKMMTPEAGSTSSKKDFAVKNNPEIYEGKVKKQTSAQSFSSFMDKVKNDDETKSQIILGLKIAIGILFVCMIAAIIFVFSNNSQDTDEPDWMNTEITTEAETQTTESTTEAVTTEVAVDGEIETTVVPNFTILSYETISNNSTYNENFDLVYEFVYSDTAAVNSIISQSVSANLEVSIGTSITLVVSKGTEPIVLVSVVGYSYDDAEEILTDIGFVVSKDVIENSGEKNADEVYMMSLVADLEFEVGTQIVLTVWGEVPTTVPETTETVTQEETEDSTEDVDQDESEDE